jgi:hypothetical protein
MKRSVALLAASLAAGVASTAGAMPFDQLHCRRVRDDVPKRRVRAELVARDPVFGSATGCILKLPARYLCDGSALTGMTPEMPGAAAGPEAPRYLCYRARCDDGGQTLTVHDQFGEHAVEVKSSRLVCAPVHASDAPSTTSTSMAPETTTSTTMAPPDTTSTTLAPPETTSTTVAPPETTSTSVAPPVTTTTTAPPPTSTTATLPPPTSTSSTTLPTTSTSLPASTSSTSVPASTTTTTTLGGPQPPSAGCPVVNEVMTGGATSASEEFVEILNPCAHALELAGARLLYRSATGATERVLASWDAGRVVAPGGRLVYATSLFPGASDGTFVAGLAAAGGGVAVVDAAGMPLDSVGWGTAANGFVEGSVAPAPAAGTVIARIPDGADTNDGAGDFEQASPTPGTAN